VHFNVKSVKFNVVMRQHNIWCVYVRSVWRCVPDSVRHISSHRKHLHTPNVMLPHHHI